MNGPSPHKVLISTDCTIYTTLGLKTTHMRTMVFSQASVMKKVQRLVLKQHAWILYRRRFILA